jgi:LysR family transcriptional regulator, glycine cleavage system transcriptional activator
MGPSPALLRSFESAARLGSLTLAAAELGVTPGAIGHAVRALEDWTGTPLLRREGRRLRPTDAAQRALSGLTQGFALLDASAASMRGARKSLVTVAVDPSFAALWLVPRLAAFRQTAGGAEFRLVPPASDPLAEPDVDLALLYRSPRASNLDVTILMREQVLPVCAPSLKSKHATRTGFPQKRRLLHVELGRDDTDYPSWPAWCRAAGIDPARAADGSRFSHAVVALQAAMDGQGIALASTAMAAEALKAGRLVAAIDDPPRMSLTRYLAVRRRPEPRPVARRLCRFLRTAANGYKQG